MPQASKMMCTKSYQSDTCYTFHIYGKFKIVYVIGRLHLLQCQEQLICLVVILSKHMPWQKHHYIFHFQMSLSVTFLLQIIVSNLFIVFDISPLFVDVLVDFNLITRF